MSRLCLVAAACAGLLANSGARAANCLDGDMVAAARALEFQTAMMVASLRCAAVKLDISTEYREFSNAHSKIFKGADEKVRKHFGAQGKAGHLEYQHFMTSLGNHYGGERTDPQSCVVFKSVAAELSKPRTDVASVARYIDALVPEPLLGTSCVLASAK